jgi:hypothetical protein
MRTQMLGGLALLLGAAALLCGPDVARAQWSGYAAGGYPQAYASGAQAAQAAYWRSGYGQAGNYNGFTPYNQSYGYYPNYYSYYPYYYGYGYQGYYPNNYQQYNATPYPTAGSGGAADVAVPTLPLVSDGPGSEDGPMKKSDEPVHHDCFWVSGSYEASWFKPWRLTTPLVTTGSTTDAHPGALGQPGTASLLGTNLDFGMVHGVSLGAGFYLDQDAHCSLEWTGFLNLADHIRFSKASDAAGNPLITRPVFNAVDQTNRAFFDSFPDVAQGGIAIDGRSQLIGSEINARYRCCPAEHFQVDALLGFRFLRLTESLTIRDRVQPLTDGVLTFLGNGIPATDALTDVDSFRTSNHFYGLQLGGGAHWDGKWVYAGIYGKVAIGATDEQADINGSTTLYSPGASPQGAAGGILALPGNMGQHNRTIIGFVPEGGLDFGVNITPCVRLTAGYSFLYWNAVVRPGGQIDPAVNTTTIPTDQHFGTAVGPLRPTYTFHDENYWVHMVRAGVMIHY